MLDWQGSLAIGLPSLSQRHVAHERLRVLLPNPWPKSNFLGICITEASESATKYILPQHRSPTPNPIITQGRQTWRNQHCNICSRHTMRSALQLARGRDGSTRWLQSTMRLATVTSAPLVTWTRRSSSNT